MFVLAGAGEKFICEILFHVVNFSNAEEFAYSFVSMTHVHEDIIIC